MDRIIVLNGAINKENGDVTLNLLVPIHVIVQDATDVNHVLMFLIGTVIIKNLAVIRSKVPGECVGNKEMIREKMV